MVVVVYLDLKNLMGKLQCIDIQTKPGRGGGGAEHNVFDSKSCKELVEP